MKYFSTLLVAMLASLGFAYGQTDVNFGIDPANIYPLAALQQTYEEAPPVYLFEKPEYFSPDEMVEHPIGVSVKQFSALHLDSAKRKLTIFHAEKYEMESIYGAALQEQPTLFFFTDQLYKVSFEIAPADQELLQSLKHRYGKPKKTKEEISGGTYQSYTWDGYKVAVKMIAQKGDEGERKFLIIEDKLLSKVVDADLEQRKFVQQAMLFSDVISIYR